MNTGVFAAVLFTLSTLTATANCWPWPSLSWPGSSKSTGKVLNFFPVPVTEECLSDDSRRTGLCLNAYECRIQNGESRGPCALGFGVCCVFTSSCNAEVANNVTYFVNPNFPGLLNDVGECTIRIKKVSDDISQIRLDFVHFNLAQPNRKTGVCETDTFVVSGARSSNLKFCGLNSGQHVYYDVDDVKDAVTINIRLTKANYNRMWEIKITQIEFVQRAPAGCLQYFQGVSGTIQTMNYAINGRHLADQDYVICMRQEQSMCSIVYEPCDENSFKIGPPITEDSSVEGSGDGGGGSQVLSLNAFRECSDRVMMPCDSEEFLTPQGGPGICDLLHCGNTFCSDKETPCRIESSTTPFVMRVQFGPGNREENPEDNLGMCIRYEQQQCMS
ncbi:uncharacterized protein LOC126833408 [Adelges cooleyi]|uniref:uncharacterized protein LOC126833408 n=1 Tax=Adelges cooleyi TaxID=133065 RepID=UPI0021802399|nr:uncharacterized protein LOC126833408 [Adelges cooleyi]